MSQQNVATRHRRTWTIRVATLWSGHNSIATCLFCCGLRWLFVYWCFAIKTRDRSRARLQYRLMFEIIDWVRGVKKHVSMLQQNVAKKHRRELAIRFAKLLGQARIRSLYLLVVGGLRFCFVILFFATELSDRIRVMLQYRIRFEIIDCAWCVKRHVWLVLSWKLSGLQSWLCFLCDDFLFAFLCCMFLMLFSFLMFVSVVLCLFCYFS